MPDSSFIKRASESLQPAVDPRLTPSKESLRLYVPLSGSNLCDTWCCNHDINRYCGLALERKAHCTAHPQFSSVIWFWCQILHAGSDNQNHITLEKSLAEAILASASQLRSVQNISSVARKPVRISLFVAGDVAQAKIADHKSQVDSARRAEQDAQRRLRWKDQDMDALTAKREQVSSIAATRHCS